MRHQANLLLYVPQYQGKNMAGDRNINTEGGNYNENFRDYIVNVNPNNNQTRLEYRNRQTLLNKVNNFWIKGVLEKSLLNQILIELDLEERPGAVSYPWNMAVQSPNNKPKPLPQGTKIIDIFEQIDEGESLLILGEPGAGKTTTLLNLTRELIDRAKNNDADLIPVVFNLSSWKVNKSKFADWLVEELNSQYKVPNRIARSFIKQDRLLLLLDGLDEVKAGYRDDCINALNQFRQEHCPKIVVCSRIKDYETLDKSLQFQKAICLRLLTLEQVRYYLNSLCFNITGLKALIEKDTALQELAQSPLMLNVMILAYQGVDIEDMPETNVIKERQTRLFDDYIGRMLNYDRTFVYHASSKNKHKYSKEHARSWMIWLAKKMSHESKTVFLIERIQPTWINRPVDKLLYLLIYLSLEVILHILLVLLGTLALFMFSKNLDLFQFSLKILTWGFAILFFTLYLARIGYLSTDNIDENFRIKPVENLSFSYKRFVQTWKSEFKIIRHVVPISIIIMSIVIYIVSQKIILIVLAVFFLLSFLALSIFVSGAVESEEIKQKTIPNQGIKKSLINLLFLTLIIYPYFQVMVLLSQHVIFKLILNQTLNNTELIICSIVSSFSFSISAAILISGKPVIQHFSLRLVLWVNGFIPWNYTQFLDYATERIFLQKVGGGYIFIHRMLMEHFAKMDLPRFHLSDRLKSIIK